MAIQFACTTCLQPIEVDDEHGGKQVSCPYCRNIITAPMESTLQPGSVPAAQSAAGAPSGPPTPPGAGTLPPRPMQFPPPPEVTWAGGQPTPWPATLPVPMVPAPVLVQRNMPGIIGAVCGLLSIALFCVTVSTASAHQRDLGIRPDGKMDQAEVQQRVMDLTMHLEQHPWLVRMLGAFTGSALCWVIGLTCSIVGMSKRYRSHTPAVAGLVITVFPLLLLCAGVFKR
jgi:hypothetical protein